MSSSLPLEFEVAKALVAKDFSVTADFTYSRDDLALVKDFSVDLRATAFTRSAFRQKRPSCPVDLLVECKQRARSTWLFFPDPNKVDFQPYDSPFSALDQFSRWFFLRHESVLAGDSSSCYKGLEIDESNGNVYDAEIRHGIFQLQYALPRLLAELIRDSATAQFDEHAPFFIAPILVTNAPLVVARRNLTARQIQTATAVRQLGREVPHLVYHVDVGPEFERHCARESSPLEQYVERFRETERLRIQQGEYEGSLPSSLIRSLMSGGVSGPRVFSAFVVCTLASFPSLIGRIKAVANRQVGGMRPKRPSYRRRKRRTA